MCGVEQAFFFLTQLSVSKCKLVRRYNPIGACLGGRVGRQLLSPSPLGLKALSAIGAPGALACSSPRFSVIAGGPKAPCAFFRLAPSRLPRCRRHFGAASKAPSGLGPPPAFWVQMRGALDSAGVLTDDGSLRALTLLERKGAPWRSCTARCRRAQGRACPLLLGRGRLPLGGASIRWRSSSNMLPTHTSAGATPSVGWTGCTAPFRRSL